MINFKNFTIAEHMNDKRKVIHISTHYHPINGGQQIYIKNLINSFPEFNHVVMQLAVDGVTYPENIIAIPASKLFGYKALQFYYFNHAVKIKIKDLILSGVFNPECDIVLCHYAFHLSSVRQFRNVIILSHGVEWDGPGSILRKIYHCHRYLINKFAIKNSSASFVANDINYFKHLGYFASPADYFVQIDKNRWLIPNCIDIDRFCRARDEVSLLPKNSIIVPRNIVPQRGMDIVIKAFSKLRSLENFKGYKLVIVGAVYDKEYFNFLKMLIANLGIDDGVVFYGSARPDEMPAIYSSAEMTVIFSLYREGTSLAALESMSCGTPVITSDVGGLKEIPSVKSDENNLHLTMAYVLENKISIIGKQMVAVRDTYNFSNWKNGWKKVFERFMK
jgi:glycosyltransferase involved in cell wall biosynthesis